MIEHGRAQVEDQFVNAVQRTLRHPAHGLQQLIDLPRLGHIGGLFRGVDEGQVLADIIVQLAGDALALFFLGRDHLAQQLAAHPLFALQLRIQPAVLHGDRDVVADRGQQVSLVPVELARLAGADAHAAQGAAVRHERHVHQRAQLLHVDRLRTLASIALDLGHDDQLLAVDDPPARTIREPELLNQACCGLGEAVVHQQLEAAEDLIPEEDCADVHRREAQHLFQCAPEEVAQVERLVDRARDGVQHREVFVTPHKRLGQFAFGRDIAHGFDDGHDGTVAVTQRGGHDVHVAGPFAVGVGVAVG